MTTVSHPGARGARYEYGTVYATSTVFAVVTAAAARMADMCAAVAGYTASGGAPVQIAAESERLPPASCARWAAERVRVTFAAILRTNGNTLAQKSAVTRGVEALKEAQAGAATLGDTVARELCEGILFDLEEEVAQALLPQNYKKWGRHYMASEGAFSQRWVSAWLPEERARQRAQEQTEPQDAAQLCAESHLSDLPDLPPAKGLSLSHAACRSTFLS